MASDKSAVLRAEGLGKMFRHHAGGPRTFRAFVEGGWRQRRVVEPFWALRDVSFTVSPGEMLGIVGHNGSGKSTLMRLLGGVMRPDEGQVTAGAPVNGLLDLNTGMHHDLTGRENVLISGVLAGLTSAQVRARFDDIVAFAELEGFIDEPVRTYSAGMRLRLGFAVAVHVEPKILLIDEVLAVGDMAFQRKCLERIAAFRANGCAIVLISHDMGQVERTCDRAIWMDHGRMRAEGKPADIVHAYQSAILSASNRMMSDDVAEGVTYQGRRLVARENRLGSLEAELTDVRLRDVDGAVISRITPGGALTVQARAISAGGVPASHFSVTIHGSDGTTCFDVNTQNDGTEVPALTGSSIVELQLGRVDLLPGTYSLSIGLWRSDWSHAYDYHQMAYELEVTGPRGQKGFLAPPRHWRLIASE